MNYYTFEIDDKKVGYFEYEDKDGVLYQNARIMMGGEKLENPFWVKHHGCDIVAYKCGDGDYVELPVNDNAVPSAALMLFAWHMAESEKWRFPLINEGTGAVIGEASFVCEGEKVQVLMDGKPINYFIIHDDRIIEFGWGGTVRSRYMPTREEAVSGTGWS